MRMPMAKINTEFPCQLLSEGCNSQRDHETIVRRSHHQGVVDRSGMLEERTHIVLGDRRFIDVQSARQSGISFAGAKPRHGE